MSSERIEVMHSFKVHLFKEKLFNTEHTKVAGYLTVNLAPNVTSVGIINRIAHYQMKIY